jgi:plasmid stability protein
MANITIKDVPDELYEKLKELADDHRRSINQEVITCLERYVGREQVSAEEQLKRARELRVTPRSGELTESELDEAINKGRE